ncbi:hypothetical protein ELE36_12965 [Pseudolysobacter antarcticus]|uniref:ABM domain-containing protein n=1 Tax=Pseudolysobacter antarcticus TaxID=2511995 RepID=A0A411HKY4_9GAMM|nr:YdhR family protein [Pseudolysobacter antarcticus]QBB71189.1 hypothetical protein ELE36_12965 [Pseudolysobacter antarcticus]
MIGVLVRFRYGNDFSEARVRQVADAARGKFVNLPGLRSKAFTVDPQRREALNFYVWETEDAARAFFTAELTERVAGLYGVAPSVEFVSIAALIENPPP